MSPEVTAAVIAASVSFLTLIGTLAAQYVGRRATSEQPDRTFAEQRSRGLNERFATAAEQLGSDKPAVRLAGVYASSLAARSASAVPHFSGGRVTFNRAQFSGGTVDFSDAADWSCPPAFPWTGTPPSGVKLPSTAAQRPGSRA
jgi:hypothetical protein